MTDSPNLALPYILPAQAQKHVTHNEAIRALDCVVQLSVVSRILTAPPGSPADGGRYLVAAGATGAWAGQSGNIAAFQDGTWAFYAPQDGWIAWVEAENIVIVYSAGSWSLLPSTGVTDHGMLTGLGDDDHTQYLNNARGDARYTPINPTTFGINATADTTNRLAVSSAASLFNNAGNGHQVKVNKNAAADTASFLFQTGFSGRAEIGLIADDSFHFKVSSDGSSFTEALLLDKTTGAATFQGLTAQKAVALSPANANVTIAPTGTGSLAINPATAGTIDNVSIGATTAGAVKATQIGVNAASDATNKLNVASSASLFTNIGNGHQVKVNKNAAGDTASFLFQTNFSGRAEIGTTGDDDFHFKVSPDGTTFKEALKLNKTTAQAYGRANGAVPAIQASVLTADLTLSNVATAQAFFGTSQDEFALEASTTYFFEAEISMSRAAGTTSHTTSIVFGGTATLTSIDYMAQISNPTGNALSAVNSIWGTSAAALVVTAANVVATENILLRLKGTVRSNAAGTFIPQFQYSAAPGGAPTVRRNSCFRLYAAGDNSLAALGGVS